MNAFLIRTLVLGLALGFQLPQKTVWKPTRDIPLNGIAEMAYGHRSFMRLIAIYNRLDTMETAPKGTIIKTPPLPELFQDLGLLPRFQDQFDGIFHVIENFPGTIHDYQALGRDQGFTDQEREEAHRLMIAKMNAYATKLEKAISELETLTANGNTPKHMLERLKTAARSFRSWANQAYDPSLRQFKDMDFVQQQLARALANAAAWSRE